MKLDDKLKPYFESKGQNADECILYLLACRHGLKYRCSEETFQFLDKEKMIKLNFMTNTIIPLVGIYDGEVVELNVDYEAVIEQEVRERIDEYRSMFKGIRSGSIGEKQKVITMLTQFCIQNQKSFDDVLLVTKAYMSYTDFKVISNADNFISKLDKEGNEISLLKIAFEEQDMSSQSTERTYKMI